MLDITEYSINCGVWLGQYLNPLFTEVTTLTVQGCEDRIDNCLRKCIRSGPIVRRVTLGKVESWGQETG